MGTMDPQQAQDIIDNGGKGKGGAVISEPNTFSWADSLVAGVSQGVGEVFKDVNHALNPNKGKSIEDILKAAGASPEQIKAIMASMSGGGSGGSGGGFGGFSTPDPMETALFDTYFRLWGKKPPHGVIQSALHQGLNVFQFEDQIRQDPAFKHTETYQNEMADNVLSLARQLGFLPG